MALTSEVVLSFTITETLTIAGCVWALTWVLIKHSLRSEQKLLEQKFESLTKSITALTESLERLQDLYHQLDKDVSVKTNNYCRKE